MTQLKKGIEPHDQNRLEKAARRAGEGELDPCQGSSEGLLFMSVRAGVCGDEQQIHAVVTRSFLSRGVETHR